MGAATVLMGCLPTFAPIGYWAPALLVVLRFIQGFAVGGEWGGAVLLIAEHSQGQPWILGELAAGRRARRKHAGHGRAAGSHVHAFGRGVPRLGWRVAFWLSAVVVLIGYYIRTRVTDAPIFLEAQQEADRSEASRLGAIDVLKRYPHGVFTAMG